MGFARVETQVTRVAYEVSVEGSRASTVTSGFVADLPDEFFAELEHAHMAPEFNHLNEEVRRLERMGLSD